MEHLPPPVIITPGQPPGPVILALPHSGAFYPEHLRARSRLSALTLRRSEDAHLQTLLDFAPEQGITTVATPYARAYIDMNRDAADIDPQLIGAPVSAPRNDRIMAGLGVVPRIVGTGLDIYAQTLTLHEVEQRITHVHVPYHTALQRLLAETYAQHGAAILLDCHSMPSPKIHGRPLAQMVLGDRHGQSCAAALIDLVEQALERQQFHVARNDPYAGGFTTGHYGAPLRGVHVLQIEMDRSLYMDEVQIIPHDGFERLRAQLAASFAMIIAQVQALLPQLRPIPTPRLAAE